MERVTDPLERDSLEAQINEFGQTPKQLFDVPHPKKVPKVHFLFSFYTCFYYQNLLLTFYFQYLRTKNISPTPGILRLRFKPLVILFIIIDYYIIFE